MSLYVMSKTILPEWIEHLCGSYRLFGPVLKQNHYVFSEVQSAAELDLAYTTSALPPKKILLPQNEELFNWHSTAQHAEMEANYQAVIEDQPTLVFGVHNCDLHAIHLLDQAYNGEFRDQHYWARRESTIFVSLECLSPCTQYAFCKDMGTLSLPEDFDLHLTDLGDTYAIYAGSQRGENLLEGFDQVRQADETECQQLNRVMSSKWSLFTYRLQADISELPGLMSVSYKSVLWEELSKQCLGCGMCTIACPTCYCFDLRDEVDFSLSSGKRYRVWDSCQLYQFAVVAGGHDFRARRSERQRHRFLRKYKYQSLAPGLLGCVGCGRCASACPVRIDPVEALNILYQRRAATTRREQEIALA